MSRHPVVTKGHEEFSGLNHVSVRQPQYAQGHAHLSGQYCCLEPWRHLGTGYYYLGPCLSLWPCGGLQFMNSSCHHGLCRSLGSCNLWPYWCSGIQDASGTIVIWEGMFRSVVFLQLGSVILLMAGVSMGNQCNNAVLSQPCPSQALGWLILPLTGYCSRQGGPTPQGKAIPSSWEKWSQASP